MNRRRSGKTNRKKENRPTASELFGSAIRELFVDGYNLMHVTRFKPRGHDEGVLRRCREGLLQLLADRLPASSPFTTTVVFDAANAPPRFPSEMRWRHLHVRFSRDENSADDQITQMLREHERPTSVLVVSSDHRVQLAARRRGAKAVDSEIWFDVLLDWSASTKAARDPPSPIQPDETLESSLPDSEDGGELNVKNPFPDGYLDDLETEFYGEW